MALEPGLPFPFLPTPPSMALLVHLILLRINCNSLLHLIRLPPHKTLLLNGYNRSPILKLFRHNHQTQAILSLS